MSCSNGVLAERSGMTRRGLDPSAAFVLHDRLEVEEHELLFLYLRMSWLP